MVLAAPVSENIQLQSRRNMGDSHWRILGQLQAPRQRQSSNPEGRARSLGRVRRTRHTSSILRQLGTSAPFMSYLCCRWLQIKELWLLLPQRLRQSPPLHSPYQGLLTNTICAPHAPSVTAACLGTYFLNRAGTLQTGTADGTGEDEDALSDDSEASEANPGDGSLG